MSYEFSPGWRKFSVAVLRRPLTALFEHDWRDQGRVPRTGPVIVVANHLSPVDPLPLALFLFDAGRYPAFLAKASVFKVKIVGALLRRFGQIPVYRYQADAALAYRAAESALHADQCVVLYPEGTVTRDERLWPMTGQTGAARMALATGAPVIPVGVWGPQDVIPYRTHGKGFHLLPRKTMHLMAGPPVDLSGYAGRPADKQALHEATDDIMRAIAELVGQLRGERPPARLYDHRSEIERRAAAEQRVEPKTIPPARSVRQSKPAGGRDDEEAQTS